MGLVVPPLVQLGQTILAGSMCCHAISRLISGEAHFHRNSGSYLLRPRPCGIADKFRKNWPPHRKKGTPRLGLAASYRTSYI